MHSLIDLLGDSANRYIYNHKTRYEKNNYNYEKEERKEKNYESLRNKQCNS